MPDSNDRRNIAEQVLSRSARIGLVLFAVYLALYCGFVILNVFLAEGMATTIFEITISVWYGLGLIVAALVLALVYAWLCRTPQSQGEEHNQ